MSDECVKKHPFEEPRDRLVESTKKVGTNGGARAHDKLLDTNSTSQRKKSEVLTHKAVPKVKLKLPNLFINLILRN